VTVTALNVIPLMENALVAKEPQLATEPEYNRINANVLPVILILDLMIVKVFELYYFYFFLRKNNNLFKKKKNKLTIIFFFFFLNLIKKPINMIYFFF
jgi:hypothetical protein